LWVKEVSDKYNLIYQFHLLETKPENENFFKEKNINLMNYLEKIGFLSKNLIAAHSVWLTDEDIAIMRRNNVTVSHNPNSNLKLNSGIIRLKSLLEKDVNITLGTDGAASNNHLSLLSEMNVAAKLHHIESSSPINVETIFDMVTKNPEKVLNNKLGQIKEGFKADLVFIKRNHFSMLPCHNPISNIVYSMPNEAIDAVMINGKFIMKERKLLTINENAFYKELKQYLNKINLKGFLKK
jgi:5-methylthioadenosine/S-adenosylhomocysteine deaminase